MSRAGALCAGPVQSRRPQGHCLHHQAVAEGLEKVLGLAGTIHLSPRPSWHARRIPRPRPSRLVRRRVREVADRVRGLVRESVDIRADKLLVALRRHGGVSRHGHPGRDHLG